MDSNVGGPCTLTCPQQIMGKKEGTHIQYSDKPWHPEDPRQPSALCKWGGWGWRATRREGEPGLRSKASHGTCSMTPAP